jgi:hypothetical protein
MDFVQGVPWTPPESTLMPDPAVPGIATFAEDTLTSPERANGLGFSRYV